MPENKALDHATALKRAAALCSRQEQCSFDIRQKLERWEVDEKDRESILKKLQEEKFIDDSRYAVFYVKDKFRFNHWGRIKIKAMLRQKQMDETLISTALAEINEEDYFKTCLEQLQNKDRQLKEEDPYKRRAKLLRFGAQRGFESGLLYTVIDEVIQ